MNQILKAMLVRIYSAACLGLEVIPVTVEVSVTPGVGIFLVGLPDGAVRESLLRVTTALQACGYRIPGKKIVINLAPADVRKEGSLFDCAIAMGILFASEQIRFPMSEQVCLWGELALDGSLRRVPGSLPLALYARDAGFEVAVFPAQVAEEAACVEGVRICGAEHLSQLVPWLEESEFPGAPKRSPAGLPRARSRSDDFAWVVGQPFAKRGLEIAAAGGHNIILVGPPGAGKSFMARCLASILPPMSLEESLETRKIYSVAGKGIDFSGEDLLPPFRAPHHTASLVSLTGGGAQALPGEISLAHNGVLYLDEMVQFSPTLLNLLRQPLEERKISISRAKYKVTYPASFMLVGSMNPCPCGFYGDGTDRCRCGEGVIQRYWSRLSGPLLDRIDLQIFVHSVDPMSLVDRAAEEASAVVAERVTRARSIQKARFAQEGIFCNAAMDSRLIDRWCVLDPSCKDLLEKMVRKLNLSARGCSRLLKLARTLADLAGQESIQVQHLAEAVGYCRAKE